jgi:hypothetical protein
MCQPGFSGVEWELAQGHGDVVDLHRGVLRLDRKRDLRALRMPDDLVNRDLGS